MSRVIVLLAGYPATGKSTFCRSLLVRHPEMVTITPDDIKEEVWDKVGFDNAAEKEKLEPYIWEVFYFRLAHAMNDRQSIITDYPFSDKQRPRLVELIGTYHYHAVTIRFVGDIPTIYKRSRVRDLSQSRHLGHLMSHYHKGDYLADHSKADQLITLEILRKRCVEKGYGQFQLGDLIEVDATDITSIHPDTVIDRVETCLGGGF